MYVGYLPVVILYCVCYFEINSKLMKIPVINSTLLILQVKM